jgi:hypothetical protein
MLAGLPFWIVSMLGVRDRIERRRGSGLPCSKSGGGFDRSLGTSCSWKRLLFLWVARRFDDYAHSQSRAVAMMNLSNPSLVPFIPWDESARWIRLGGGRYRHRENPSPEGEVELLRFLVEGNRRTAISSRSPAAKQASGGSPAPHAQGRSPPAK